MDDLLSPRPGLEPHNEIVVSDAPAFVAASMEQISAYADKFGRRLGKSLLTRSETFGLILRVDFRGAPHPQIGDSGDYVNRLAYWGDPNGTIVGPITSFQYNEPLKDGRDVLSSA